MSNLTELNKLEEYLKANGIEYNRYDDDNLIQVGIFAFGDRHQITVGEKERGDGSWDWDVICHHGSYGFQEGKLEGMGSIFEGELEGWLTADDVIARIEKSERKS